MTKDTSGSAFPVSTKAGFTVYGMTLRQWYAGMALQGLLAHASGESPRSAPELAWKLADAMIAQGEKE